MPCSNVLYCPAAGSEDVPKPTTSLDYKYLRSSVGMSLKKDLSHFWELGGGRALVNLLDIALTADRLRDSFVVIVLDLSKPWRVLADATYYLDLVRKRVDVCLTGLREAKVACPLEQFSVYLNCQLP